MGNGRNQLLSRWTAVFVSFLFFVHIAVANLADAQQSAERGTRTPLPAEVARPASLYKYKALHDFCRAFDCPDGLAPNGDLIFDGAGNLYGTTCGGGDFSPCQAVGCGTVFQLSPEGNGTWKHTILHEFHSEFEAQPSAGLVMDAAGNLYGPIACAGGCGAVFELSRLVMEPGDSLQSPHLPARTGSIRRRISCSMPPGTCTGPRFRVETPPVPAGAAPCSSFRRRPMEHGNSLRCSSSTARTERVLTRR